MRSAAFAVAKLVAAEKFPKNTHKLPDDLAQLACFMTVAIAIDFHRCKTVVAGAVVIGVRVLVGID